ncbi:MAG: TRAP transporter small permease [Candidatus Rokubacteria bacterium]|nr:TRAP transporter small permease [Candidatus Rokubacteria bacterium]
MSLGVRRVLDLWASKQVILTTSKHAVFTTVVAYQVFSRYVEVVPRFLWTEEISRFSFIWMLFLGAAVAVRKQTHFLIDLVPTWIEERYGRLVDVFVLAIMLAVAAVILLGAIRFVPMGMKRVSTTSGLQLAWIYMAIPVSAVSMIAFALEQLWDLLRARRA